MSERIVSADEAPQIIASIRERLARSSPGPCRLSMYDPDRDPVELFRENLSHGSGNVWAVGLPEHPFSVGGWEDRPGHLVITCVTGNGPTSEANAVFYANARADIEILLSRLESVERERDRLRDILAAERGERAPEGWSFHAPDMNEDGDPRAWWHCGIVTVLSTSIGWEVNGIGRRSIHRYALEAIEAADRAAKENK